MSALGPVRLQRETIAQEDAEMFTREARERPESSERAQLRRERENAFMIAQEQKRLKQEKEKLTKKLQDLAQELETFIKEKQEQAERLMREQDNLQRRKVS